MGTLAASDAELATLACAGEVEALAALLERYRPSLYAAAIRLLRNRDDALDAVQETCVVALVRLGALRDPEAVGGWLHAVLRRRNVAKLAGVEDNGGRRTETASGRHRHLGCRTTWNRISSLRCSWA